MSGDHGAYYFENAEARRAFCINAALSTYAVSPGQPSATPMALMSQCVSPDRILAIAEQFEQWVQTGTFSEQQQQQITQVNQDIWNEGQVAANLTRSLVTLGQSSQLQPGSQAKQLQPSR